VCGAWCGVSCLAVSVSGWIQKKMWDGGVREFGVGY